MEFAQLIKDKNARHYFSEFLRKEYSLENLDFWIQCQEFKKLKTKKQLKKCAELIYGKFISVHGDEAVNIDHSVRKIIEKNLQNPTVTMFDVAEEQIFKLMQSDSYSRFVKTDLYEKFKSIYDKQYGLTRKRKLTEPSLQVNACENQPNSSESTMKCSSAITETKSNLVYKNQPNYNLNEKNNEIDYCDASLYCNAPIYSLDKSFETTSSHTYCNCPKEKKWLNNRYIRVLFPDYSEEFIPITQSTPIRQLIEKFFQKKSLIYTSYSLFSIQNNEIIELDTKVSDLVFTDIRVQQNVNFFMHFPEGYVLHIETSPHKLLYYVLKTILSYLGINMHDIEMYDDQRNLLFHDTMIKPTINFDYLNVYINYLSSLRTYINLNNINDLNDDGINIKSINFRKKTSVNHKKLKTSFNSFTIDNKNNTGFLIENQNKIPNKSEKQEEEVKNVNLADLSFSNENKTEEFLNDIMTTDPNKLNYICTPKKQILNEPKYENVRTNSVKVSGSVSRNRISMQNTSNLHKARLIFIDENDYANDVNGQQNISSDSLNMSLVSKLCIEKPKSDLQCNCQIGNEENIKRCNLNITKIQLPKANVTRRQSSLRFNSPKILPTGSPYRKYLLQSELKTQSSTKAAFNSERKGGRLQYSQSCSYNQRPERITSSNKPDIILSAKTNKINTLSKFHKIVKF